VQTTKARDDMNNVLGEIRHLREDVKDKFGAGLNDLSAAAQRISAGIASELDSFHTQVRSQHSNFRIDTNQTSCMDRSHLWARSSKVSSMTLSSK